MVRIDGCPNQYCRSVVPAANLIDLFNKGLPPVAGGVLDQSASFLEAVRYLGAEENKIEVEDEQRRR